MSWNYFVFSSAHVILPTSRQVISRWGLDIRNWLWKVQKLKSRKKHDRLCSIIVKYRSFRFSYLSRHHGCLSFYTCCNGRNSISGHGAKISLICNETMAENEAIFEFINVTNIPTDTYVSMKWKHVDVLLCVWWVAPGIPQFCRHFSPFLVLCLNIFRLVLGSFMLMWHKFVNTVCSLDFFLFFVVSHLVSFP